MLNVCVFVVRSESACSCGSGSSAHLFQRTGRQSAGPGWQWVFHTTNIKVLWCYFKEHSVSNPNISFIKNVCITTESWTERFLHIYEVHSQRKCCNYHQQFFISVTAATSIFSVKEIRLQKDPGKHFPAQRELGEFKCLSLYVVKKRSPILSLVKTQTNKRTCDYQIR